MLRYPIDFAFQIVAMYLFFVGVFFGGQAIVDQVANGVEGFGETFEGIIVGWFLWTMAQTAYMGLQQDVTAESRWGTLEQLFMSPYGFNTVMSLKTIVNVLFAFLWGFVVLLLMMVTTQRWLVVDFWTVIPITILTLMPAIGIGFGIGGLALVYKKISSINSIMQFVLIGLIAAPVTDAPLVGVLPLAQGSTMLQTAMRDGTALWEFSLVDLSILLGTGLAYFLVGFVVFYYASRVARKRGVMSHY
ncbi:ABC transporter [Natrinema saccharevitans]|uniref:ABC transporter n=2 Tax=Natrinema saccharevitans TaxID=301967 RepID=A0A1S8B0W2_9EURY|nr:ABC transporter [Natrinema saccharevitans]